VPCPRLIELPNPPPGKSGWPWTEETPPLPENMPNGDPWPKISIVTPSYNQGKFIEETIRSVLLQGYPNQEYIIVDGGSTDGSLEIIRKYEPWLAYWVSEPDAGQSDAINKGWEKSDGEIIAWLNTDDTYNSCALQHVATMFHRNESAVLLSGAANTTDVFGRTILFTKESPDIDPYVMLKQSGGVPTQPSVFVRRTVIDEVGFLNIRLHYVMDWEFWIRIGLRYAKGRLKKTTHVLSNNREWPETKTNKAWKYICPENRQVFEDIFKRFKKNDDLQRIKRTAYSASYRKHAFLARRHGKSLEAMKSLIWGWCLNPSAYKFTEEFTFLRSLLIDGIKCHIKKVFNLQEAKS